MHPDNNADSIVRAHGDDKEGPRGYEEGADRRRGAIATVCDRVALCDDIAAVGAKVFPGAEEVFPRRFLCTNNDASTCTFIAYMYIFSRVC